MIRILCLSLLISFIAHTACSQHYYNDLVTSSEIVKKRAIYQTNKVKTVKMTSFDNNNQPIEGFGGSQEIAANFATITTDANRQLANIQERMPVIIERQDWPIWLGEVEGDPTSLLQAAPEDVLRVWRVGKAVGNVKNDGAELIEPAEAAEPTLL